MFRNQSIVVNLHTRKIKSAIYEKGTFFILRIFFFIILENDIFTHLI